MKFLVFSTDLPPIEGHPTSGTALRTFNISEGLKELGHEVVFSPPRDAVDKFKKLHPNDLPKELELNSFDASNQASVISKNKPDVILCGHWPAWTLGRKPSQPLIIDLAGPHLLERHYQKDRNLDGGILGKLSALSSADYFIASGQKQKLYFLSFLVRAKIPNPHERITIVPMPLPSIEKTEILSINEYPKFIFGGVFLPWQNPAWGLKTLSQEIQKKNKGHLTIVGGPHPHYPINSELYNSLYSELEKNPNVTRKPLLPYNEFQDEMKNNHIALDLMEWNLERELAITIRSCTYLWSGIPIIYNDYSDLSKLVSSYDAGWCVKPGDEEGFHKIISEIYDNPAILSEKRNGAFKLASENFDRVQHAKQILSLIEIPSVSFKAETDITVESGDNCNIFLNKNTVVKQKFVSRINGLKKVKLLVANHGKSSHQNIELKVTDDLNNLIKSEIIESKNISDNQWVSLEFDPLKDSAGKTFEIELKSIGASDNSTLSPWTISYSPYPLVGLFVNNKKYGSYSLCMKTTSSRS